MSTQKGNVKKTGQKYQNQYTFKHNKNSMTTRRIAETPLDLLCEKCLNVLEWKIKYRKYKPLTKPSKCNICEEKNVLKGHRTVCDVCSKSKKLCTKCGEECEHFAQPMKNSKHLRKPIDTTFQDIIDTLKERQRKTVQRRMDKGEDLIFDGSKGIINKESKEVIFSLMEINNGVLADDYVEEEENEDDDNEDIENDDKEDNEEPDNIEDNEGNDRNDNTNIDNKEIVKIS